MIIIKNNIENLNNSGNFLLPNSTSIYLNNYEYKRDTFLKPCYKMMAWNYTDLYQQASTIELSLHNTLATRVNINVFYLFCVLYSFLKSKRNLFLVYYFL